MRLPEKLNRKRIKFHFHKLGDRTWDYLFDHEKDNGLVSCRTQGFGVKELWYSAEAVKRWLIERNYYDEEEFEKPRQEKKTARATPWSALAVST